MEYFTISTLVIDHVLVGFNLQLVYEVFLSRDFLILISPGQNRSLSYRSLSWHRKINLDECSLTIMYLSMYKMMNNSIRGRSSSHVNWKFDKKIWNVQIIELIYQFWFLVVLSPSSSSMMCLLFAKVAVRKRTFYEQLKRRIQTSSLG